MPPSTVQGRMASGAGWMLLLTFVDRSVGVVSTLILARLLVPADFGIVAMAWSFIFIAELLAAFGFDVALIQKQDATRRHFDTAWTMNVSLGAVILIMMLVAAGPVSRFYDQPAVFWVICALAWSPLIAGFENIGVVAFRKDLDFRKEFAYQIIRRLVGFAVTIPLALLMRNYWALVIGYADRPIRRHDSELLRPPIQAPVLVGGTGKPVSFLEVDAAQQCRWLSEGTLRRISSSVG